MIELEGVRKRYPEFNMELDLSVDQGELVSILGPSGSGKTTSLRLIAGFEKPDSGRIVIDGIDVTALTPAKRQIGYVFQDYTLFPHMSVAGNVGYGLRVRGADAGSMAKKVGELLELMDLPGYEERSVQTLSGGERQRVAIARALAVDPLMLLLDEPFSSIDEVLRRELRREVVRLQQELGITVLFVTHSRQEALSISDRVAVLQGGRLIQYDSPQRLYQNPTNDFVARFVGEVNDVRVHGARCILRPEHLHVISEAEGGVDPAPAVEPGQASVAITGTVTGREFLGHLWLYTVESDSGQLLVYDEREFAARSTVTVAVPQQTILQEDAP